MFRQCFSIRRGFVSGYNQNNRLEKSTFDHDSMRYFPEKLDECHDNLPGFGAGVRLAGLEDDAARRSPDI